MKNSHVIAPLHIANMHDQTPASYHAMTHIQHCVQKGNKFVIK